MRDKTRKLAGQQLNQDIISQTIDTVEQELTLVDTNLLSIMNQSRRSRVTNNVNDPSPHISEK